MRGLRRRLPSRRGRRLLHFRGRRIEHLGLLRTQLQLIRLHQLCICDAESAFMKGPCIVRGPFSLAFIAMPLTCPTPCPNPQSAGNLYRPSCGLTLWPQWRAARQSPASGTFSPRHLQKHQPKMQSATVALLPAVSTSAFSPIPLTPIAGSSARLVLVTEVDIPERAPM